MNARDLFLAQANLLEHRIRVEVEQLASLTLPGLRVSAFSRALRMEFLKALADLEALSKDILDTNLLLPVRTFAAVQRRTNELFGEALMLRVAKYTRDEIAGDF